MRMNPRRSLIDALENNFPTGSVVAQLCAGNHKSTMNSQPLKHLRRISGNCTGTRRACAYLAMRLQFEGSRAYQSFLLHAGSIMGVER